MVQHLPPAQRLPIRVLISAYACDPTRGSEPGVGWHYVKAALAVCQEVHVLTRNKNRNAIIDRLTDSERRRCRIIPFELPPTVQHLKHSLPGGTQAYYVAWQLQARTLVKKLHTENDYDLAHHVTFSADWLPTAIHSIPGLPTVWGPVGGSGTVPPRLMKYLGVAGTLRELFRYVLVSIGKFTAKRSVAPSDVVVASSAEVADQFGGKSQHVVIESSAITPPSDPAQWNGQAADFIVGIGRLLPHKGWALAIDALAQSPNTKLKLVLIGAGTDRQRLTERARKRNVYERVVFAGHLPREEVMNILREARASVFPSFHETSGTALAESIASGCPAIALDVAGPSDIIRRSGGTLVSARSPRLVRRLSEALTGATPPDTPGAWSPERLPTRLYDTYSTALVKYSSVTR